MSAPVMSLLRCYQRSAVLFTARQLSSSSSSSVSPPSLYSRALIYLSQRFYDVEEFLKWRAFRKSVQLEKDNCYYSYTENLYGADIAAAFFVLCMKGGFRFVDQSDWYRADKKGKFDWGFLNYRDTQLQDVDMSHSLVNYTGLDNLKGQKSLRTLSVRGCPLVNGWFLARLYWFEDSLEELDISHCPLIDEGALSALRHLKGLKRLDVSSLPKITAPGMMAIMLEEMLPECQVIATGYDDSLMKLEGKTEAEEHMQAQR